MKKFRNCIRNTSLAFLSFYFLIMIVFAADFEVGVKVGDWAKYNYTFEFKADPPQPLPQEFEKARQVSHSRVEVKEVFDKTSLKLQETIFYKNGSQKNNFLIGDVKTGGGNLSIQVIARNLNVGDKIYTAPDAPFINRTERIFYAGAMRDVNRVFKIEFSPMGENYTAIDLYWDRETGILCEVIISSYMSTSGGGKIITIIKCIIDETNLWVSETLDGWIIYAASMIVFGICALYISQKIFGKRFKRRNALRRCRRLLAL